ncbi:HAD-IA family hydrolase [Faecalicatena sp. AGMB00832]|uniref:HAD-IA family hydrolase n=1 Tax=Faecalicatena faecalis TaxID=2726362 RepID=A0ABS6D5U1_9FIRM|nr:MULTISPECIES: HAD-IA family hydrolase [Faecalicatena]MBU3876973.1 HAD-IA family hydrolase [Faecalicatena faecalis]MCI6465925.1 HAD-IA family hydrolase [Faecalicatena sp.]MDY5618658.1 HAD-IA family hydrolase [Lachnospiraceae bacterium]
MYKACIFDLDGTLTDTLDSLTFSVNETMKEMGLLEITREQCRMFVGNGSKVLLEKALQASGKDAAGRLEEALLRYERIFRTGCTYHVVPYDGITELLAELKAAGIKTAVLSNKPDSNARSVVEEIFGTDMFAWVQGQKEDVPRKPDPAAAIEIAKRLDALPSETIYIGDSEVDIATGTAAKMKTIGVSWGFRTKEALKEAGAGLIIDSPKEIMEFIKNREVESHE